MACQETIGDLSIAGRRRRRRFTRRQYNSRALVMLDVRNTGGREIEHVERANLVFLLLSENWPKNRPAPAYAAVDNEDTSNNGSPQSSQMGLKSELSPWKCGVIARMPVEASIVALSRSAYEATDESRYLKT